MLWDDRFALGLPLIDHQHQELFARVHDFRVALARGDLKAVAEMLSYLGIYVFEHFSTEEVEMMEAGYPDFDAHREVHEAFVTTVERLGREAQASGFTPELTARLDRLVESWLTHHILEQDRLFGDWLKARPRDDGP